MFDPVVIVPARDAARTIGACLDAILAQSPRPRRVIVVDDGSSDDTRSIASAKGCEVLRSSAPGDRATGPMAPRFAGASAARPCGQLVFVDADVILPPGGIDKLCGPLVSGEAAAVTGMLDGSYRTGTWWGDLKSEYMEHVFAGLPRKVSFLYGSAFAVRADVFEVFEPIEEPFGSLVADSELGLRLSAAGRTVVLEHRLKSAHLKPHTALSLVRNDYVIPFLFARMCIAYRARGTSSGAFSHASLAQLAATLAGPVLIVASALWGAGIAPVWPAVIGGAILLSYWSSFISKLVRRRGPIFAAAALAWLGIDACIMSAGLLSGAVWELCGWRRTGGVRLGTAAPEGSA